ncbi:MAG: HlyD family efflux transporter periplasmic adaptor subunit [Deltaproteobacteria bacterium]|nr:HlyD family efflux transporter periplasmic adaptor subunit [Deltaproteobacteria bacterium]
MMPRDVYARGTQANDVAVVHRAAPRRSGEMPSVATDENPVVVDVARSSHVPVVAPSTSLAVAEPAAHAKRWPMIAMALLVAATSVLVFATRSSKPTLSGTLAPASSSAPATEESTEEDSWPGVLLAPASVDIAPTIDGRVADVKLSVGDKVQKDDVVALLDDRMHKDALAVALAGKHAASADAHRASIELTQARDRQTRREAVVKTDDGETLQVVSGEEAAQARFAAQAAASRAASAGAGAAERAARVKQLKTALSETQLRAPFAGVVAARYADPGTFVRPGQAVLRIIATTDLHVRFAVPEERSKHVVTSAKVIVLVDGKVIEASVSAVAPEVEPASRTVFVDASLSGIQGSAAAALAGRVVRVKPR